jgi:hypothetical protein
MNRSPMDAPHTETRPIAQAAEPWWRVRMLWLVIGGPLIVVVAAFATLFIALSHPDPVLTAPVSESASQRPALQGRNLATSPPQPVQTSEGSAR